MFVHRIAIEANEPEADKRNKKGSTGIKGSKTYGIPKLAEILSASKKDVGTLFSWIGINQNGEELNEHIGDIVEYGSDRYFVTIFTIEEDKKIEKTVTVKGPDLMKKSIFYDDAFL